MRYLIGILGVAAGLSGCVTPPGASALTTALEPVTNQGAPVPCDSGCRTEWERAQLWLAKHSSWKIQTATDVLLQTFNPPQSSSTYTYSITKSPVVGQSGQYQIEMELVCHNPLFGCKPAPLDVQRAFYHYVATGEDVLASISTVGMGLRE